MNRYSRRISKRSTLGSLVAALACSAPVTDTFADASFRCGSQIIAVGMARADVLAACGPPDSKTEQRQDVRSGKQVVGQTTVSRWTYVSGSITRVLVFDQDTLTGIEQD